jgi:hypothetical protein
VLPTALSETARFRTLVRSMPLFLAKGHPSFQGVLFNTLTHNADDFADKR